MREVPHGLFGEPLWLIRGLRMHHVKIFFIIRIVNMFLAMILRSGVKRMLVHHIFGHEFSATEIQNAQYKNGVRNDGFDFVPHRFSSELGCPTDPKRKRCDSRERKPGQA